jgi:glutathione-regulated potassium-efflux system ancillary protein KefC/glutathione-regulated potassium-efflux system protein KefB
MDDLGKLSIPLAAAVIAVPLFRWLRMGPVLGYLAAGVVIGPGAAQVTIVTVLLGGLATRGIPFTALDANRTQVDFVRSFGSQVYYGDASRLDLLGSAGTARAEMFVLAIDDVDASVRTAELRAQHFPEVEVFARARNRQHAFRLMDAGVRRSREHDERTLASQYDVKDDEDKLKASAKEAAAQLRKLFETDPG